MNVPTDYDDEAERLCTHPLLLPKDDDSEGLSNADKNVLKKTTNNISFAPDVKFTQQKLLRPEGSASQFLGLREGTDPEWGGRSEERMTG